MQVLVAVGLVDAQVVDAGGLEGDAGVFEGVGEFLQSLLGALQVGLQTFDAQPTLGLGVRELGPQPGQFAVVVGLLRGHGQREAFEGGAGHDDRVPVAGGDAGLEQSPPLAGEVLGASGQHPGLRVGLQPLAGELLEHVIGHHHRGLGHQAQTAHLHAADDHLQGLAGPDLVGQQHRRIGQHPHHRGRG
jgi:hypothetical protein